MQGVHWKPGIKLELVICRVCVLVDPHWFQDDDEKFLFTCCKQVTPLQFPMIPRALPEMLPEHRVRSILWTQSNMASKQTKDSLRLKWINKTDLVWRTACFSFIIKDLPSVTEPKDSSVLWLHAHILVLFYSYTVCVWMCIACYLILSHCT